MKKYFAHILKLSIGFLALYFVLYKSNISIGDLKTLGSADYLVSAYCVLLTSFLLGCWRLFILVRSHHPNFTYLNAVTFSFIGVFFNYLLPGGVGGDLIKGYYLTKETPEQKYNAIMSVLVDRIVGLASILMICLVSFLCFSAEASKSIPLLELRKLLFVGMAVAVIILTLFVYFKKYFVALIRRTFNPNGRIVKLILGLVDYQVPIKTLLFSLFLSAMANGLSIYFFAITGNQLGHSSIPLWFYFFIVPIGFMSAILPVSPGGIGVGQMVFYYLFNLYSPQAGNVGLLAISASQLITFSFALIGGLIYFVKGLKR